MHIVGAGTVDDCSAFNLNVHDDREVHINQTTGGDRFGAIPAVNLTTPTRKAGRGGSGRHSFRNSSTRGRTFSGNASVRRHQNKKPSRVVLSRVEDIVSKRKIHTFETRPLCYKEYFISEKDGNKIRNYIISVLDNL